MKKKTIKAEQQACHDISEYLKKHNIKIHDKNYDIWVVTPNRLKKKEQRRLNRLLGLHKINYTSKKMRKNALKNKSQ